MSLVYDDRNPAVRYSSGWWDEGGSSEYEGTTSRSSEAGATAQVTFTGRQITVYGTITIQGVGGSPMSSYVIDGDSSKRVQYIGRQTDTIQYLVPFYSVSDLEYGEHVLTITNEGGPEAFFYLDYFEIKGFEAPASSPPDNPTPPSSSPSPNNPSSSSSSNPPAVSESVGSSRSPSPSQIPASSSAVSSPSSPIRPSGSSQSSVTPHPKNSNLPASTLPNDQAASQGEGSDEGPPIGAIVGGVLGALAVVCIAILLFLFCRRRKRQRRGASLGNNHIPQMQNGPAPSLVTPFNPYDTSQNPHFVHGESSALLGHPQAGVTNAYPSAHNSTAASYPTVFSKTAGNADGSSNLMREAAASPFPPSSGSIASGITGGGSSGYPTGTIDSHQREMTSISSGFSGSQKLMSNVVLTAPNRAPDTLDPPPGYQA